MFLLKTRALRRAGALALALSVAVPSRRRQNRSWPGDPFAFSPDNVAADARAFAALMRHLREVDSRDRTVIMVLVENEIGMIPDSRDRSVIASQLFNQPVPSELMSYLEKHRDTLVPELRAVCAATKFKTRGTWARFSVHAAAAGQIRCSADQAVSLPVKQIS